MPLRQFIGNSVAFQPHELAVMTAAFEEALRKLGLNDRKDELTQLVARKIIKLANRGERDPAKLCEAVMQSFKQDALTGNRHSKDVMLTPPTDRNAFLSELSATEYELFRPHLASFTLSRGERPQNLGAMVEQVVFPHGGLIAMTMPLRAGVGGGAMLVGREGVVGAFGAAADAPAVCNAEVYIPGRAARISASAFRYILDQGPSIRRLTERHIAALMVQAHQTALCNAAHPVEARVARWLLEVLDRNVGFDVPLTQITLAEMLGVQRTTVNLVAGRLEAAGVINCRRGYIQVTHRDQLERHACECYGSLKSYVSHLFAVPLALASSPDPAGRKAV